MKVLVVGGTQFVGYHIVVALLQHGHDVTVFHRGADCTVHPQAKHIHGDRNKDVELLSNEQWDAVIDSCGYFPRQVKMTAEALRPKISGVFCFVSTISVYDLDAQNMDEDATKAKFKEGTDPTTEVVDGDSYGPLKVDCEKAILDCYGNRALIVRPGLIVGPRDHTQRFAYWLRRVHEGGRVLVPGSQDRPVQFVDVRDLAEFVVLGIENNLTGIFNATGPKDALTMKNLLDAMQEAIGQKGTEYIWADNDALLAQGLEEWVSFPLWLLKDGIFTANIQKGIAAGLALRPLRETIVDCLNWELNEASHKAPSNFGISREREAELLGKLAQS